MKIEKNLSDFLKLFCIYWPNGTLKYHFLFSPLQDLLKHKNFINKFHMILCSMFYRKDFMFSAIKVLDPRRVKRAIFLSYKNLKNINNSVNLAKYLILVSSAFILHQRWFQFQYKIIFKPNSNMWNMLYKHNNHSYYFKEE